MPMKLISNRVLREFAAVHDAGEQPLQEFRRRWEKSSCKNFADLRALFPGVDKVGPVYVFNIAGNKYRLVAGLSFQARRLWVKAVLTHGEYDEETWK
jgi:mRNA interferase HigB